MLPGGVGHPANRAKRHAIAHTLVNLGNLHIGTDHAGKARPYYLEALDLFAR